MEHFSDEELARIIHTGAPPQKKEALSTLCIRHQATLIRVATARLNGDIHTAQDAVQETWIAFHEWAQKTEAPRKVISKLYSLTKYKCLEILRKERRLVRFLAERADYYPYEDYLDLQDKMRIIRSFLIEGGLSESERKVWIYRQLYDFSAAEVSLRLGKTVGSVYTTFSRANRAWRQFLETFYVLPER